MSIKDELLELRDSDGTLHVDEVHEWAARHPDSGIYKRLNWDDASAARAWRYEQIRLLIRIYVRDEDSNRQTISLRADWRHGGGYREIERTFSNVELRELSLADALAELDRTREKYAYLTELARVFAALDEVPRRRRKSKAEHSSARQLQALPGRA